MPTGTREVNALVDANRDKRASVEKRFMVRNVQFGFGVDVVTWSIFRDLVFTFALEKRQRNPPPSARNGGSIFQR